jgi:hypothetical protein
MSNKDDLPVPQLHQRSGGSDIYNGAPYVFRAFKIEEMDSEDSAKPTDGSRGDFDIPLGQPSDKLMTQSSGASIPTFVRSAGSNDKPMRPLLNLK